MEQIHAKEGWFVSHLYFQIDRALWDVLDRDEQRRGLDRFEKVLGDFKKGKNCQAYCYSIWGLKADIAVMLVCPELQHLNQIEVDLATSFGGGVLETVHSFISMSEISEYISQENDYDRTLREKEGLTPDSPVYQEKMGQFRERIQAYIKDRLFPQLPEHRVMCFYPMNKSRVRDANWYMLDFEERKTYMASHAITGRKFQATVKQLVTGSIGLDNWDWGVTLFADDPFYLKKILYDMRYDEASAKFGEFGDFYIGLQLEPRELFKRLRL
ncbi:MAG: heme-dependent peroxidase [Acidobacteriota bacterium]|nr:MAG: heme-dependent peroxidase [Acidobacteriota bacterium]